MRIAHLVFGLSVTILASAAPASAQTFTTLYQFCKAKLPCRDGAGPLESPLIPDGAGNFYGTTQNYGAQTGGTLYRVSADGTVKLIFAFPAIAAPRGPLVRDVDGNLYGLESNGAHGAGGVFKLHPLNDTKTKWSFETLYSFCAGGGDCVDGSTPVQLTYEGAASGVAYDGISPLYGSTVSGGASAQGSVFRLSLKAGSWTESVVYSFCAKANCADGQSPAYALFFDASGKLYGATTSGGAANQGAIFKLTPKNGKETVVYSLCSQANCADGALPSGLTMDGSGNLIGTTSSGGDAQRGTLFRLSPHGKFKRLYSFCAEENCADGSIPLAGPTVGADGKIYGITSLDSRIYAFAPQTSTYSVLHTFCTDSKCSDGFEPLAPLTQVANGRLLGTTAFGGSQHSGGTVFAFVP